MFKKYLRNILKSCIRYYSKPNVVPDEAVLNSIHNEEFKPRRHPGTTKIKTVWVPDTFVKAVVCTLEDYPVKAILKDTEKLKLHLKGRVPPMEQEELKETYAKVQERVLRKFKDVIIKSQEDEVRFKQAIKDKTARIFREKVYNWKPMNYDVYNSLVYLLGRSAAEFAVLIKIFSEIADKDTLFKPRSFFDFGSGVGTGTWAANMYWKQHIFEYFNVDPSSDMNDLAQTLLKGGKGTGSMNLKGVFHRQFLPASNTSYDLVISAYSLMELPSLESRLETIVNLWNKTQKYLVIVEQGTNAGFRVVNEAREFILQIDQEHNKGTVFSPCPHDQVCPRFVANDGTPCNFEVSYFSLPIGAHSECRRERYSYVVFKKGKRNPEDPQWPRVVRPILVRSKHSICRLCTSQGKLEEVIFTAKKHGKTTYHCARSSKWGDLLPITLEESKKDIHQEAIIVENEVEECKKDIKEDIVVRQNEDKVK